MTIAKRKIRTPKYSGNQIETLLSTMAKQPVMPADFSRVRAQLMARLAAPVAASPVGPSHSWMPQAFKLSAAFFGTILIAVSLTIGTAVAALDSVPGQPIYPLKKLVESAQLRLASEDEKADLQLKFADQRLEELGKILEQNRQGKLSEEKAKEIVAAAVKDLQANTAAAVTAAQSSRSSSPKVKILTKLVEQSAVLKSAAIESEGEVKLELEKALETTVISQEEAIRNIERAGLKVEANPIILEINVEAEAPIESEDLDTAETEEPETKTP